MWNTVWIILHCEVHSTCSCYTSFLSFSKPFFMSSGLPFKYVTSSLIQRAYTSCITVRRVSTWTLSELTPLFNWQTMFLAYHSSYLFRMNFLASPLIDMSRCWRWWVILAGTFCRRQLLSAITSFIDCVCWARNTSDISSAFWSDLLIEARTDSMYGRIILSKNWILVTLFDQWLWVWVIWKLDLLVT